MVASPCQGESRGFESHLPLQNFHREATYREDGMVVPDSHVDLMTQAEAALQEVNAYITGEAKMVALLKSQALATIQLVKELRSVNSKLEDIEGQLGQFNSSQLGRI